MIHQAYLLPDPTEDGAATVEGLVDPGRSSIVATVSAVSLARTRAPLIAVAGATIMLLSVGAAFLRIEGGWTGSELVGSLLIVAGLIEMAAGAIRREGYILAMLAGGVTLLAGLTFTIDPVANFIPAAYVIIGWLGFRSLIQFAASLFANGLARTWTLISAATDLVLALIILTGLSAVTFSIALFGPTPAVIASLAWALALSFVITGIYLIEVASFEAESQASG